MTKVKLYCPEIMGTFNMMFGFDQPIKFIKDKRIKLKKIDHDRTKKIQDHQMGFKTAY